WLKESAQIEISTNSINPGTTVYYTVTGLLAGTTHYLRIWHADELNNWSEISNGATAQTISDSTPPGPVTDLTGLTGAVEGEIDLRWSAPGDDAYVEPLWPDSTFRIQYSTDDAFVWLASTVNIVEVSTNGVIPGTSVGHTLTGLISGTSHYIRIWHKDGIGNWSDESNGATIWAQVDVSSPAALTDLSANPGSAAKEIDLSWSVPGDDGWSNPLDEGSKFAVQRSTWETLDWSTSSVDTIFVSTHGVNQGSNVNYTVTGLLPSNSHYFKIWYRDELGNWSQESNPAAIEFDTISPAKVTNLSGETHRLAGAVLLSWSAPGNDEWEKVLGIGSEFIIQYSTWESIEWSTASPNIVTVSTNGINPYTNVQYLLTGLTPITSYYLSIWHKDEINNWSVKSPTIIVQTGNYAFTDSGISLTGIFGGDVFWGDYDNDGDLDLSVIGNTVGFPSGEGISRIYRNDNGILNEINDGIEELVFGLTDWGDYDNDGDLDLVYSGANQSLTSIKLKVYRNDGNDTFYSIDIDSAGLTTGAISWVDFDNDGDLDLCINGHVSQFEVYFRLYRNDNLIFNQVNSGISALVSSMLTWGDYDNDGDMDLVFAGIEGGSQYVTKVYENNGSGVFSLNSTAGIDGVRGGALAWADYNNDGYLDLAVCGYGDSGRISKIYKNNQNGTFTNIGSVFAGVTNSDIGWGDYDNDGDLDIAIAGDSDSGRILNIYRNDGSDVFVLETNVTNLPELAACSFAWGDYDSDRDLDFVISGENESNQKVTKVFINNSLISNTAPIAPSSGFNANYYFDTHKIELKWGDGYDDETPAGGLNYEIRAATAPISDGLTTWLISPSTGAGASPFLGNYMNTKLGSDSGIVISSTVVTNETTYYWQVRTIDSGLSKSVWSSTQSIFIGDMYLPSAVTSLNIAAYTNYQAILSWSSPGDDGLSGAFDEGSMFRIQYSTWSNVEWSTASIDTVSVSTHSVLPQTAVGYVLTGLNAKATYYIALWYADEYQNWSERSNIAMRYPDTTAPAVVTTLTSLKSYGEGDITLSWIVPGDDGWDVSLSSGSEFRIQYSTDSNEVDWSTSPVTYTKEVSTEAVSPLSSAVYTITGFAPGSTHYFKIWYADELENWSDASNLVQAQAEKDTTEPSAVSTLQANKGYYEGEIELQWNMPGDDGMDGTLLSGSEFAIQYSTFEPVWEIATATAQISISTSGGAPSTLISYMVTGLDINLTYYFRIWHMDEVNNWSTISNGATVMPQIDIVAPSGVTDLSGTTGNIEGEVILNWSSPGDNDWNHIISTGSQFKILHSTYITTWTRNLAQITVSTSGTEPITPVSYIVTGLDAGVTYYFRLWYADEMENWSNPSSTITVRTQTDSTPPSDITDLTAFTGSNTGEILLNWSAPGDDGWSNVLSTGSQFKVQHSSWDGNWDRDSIPALSTSGVNPYDSISYIVTGLTSGDTYYFMVWYADEAGNWATLSNTASAWAQFDDISAPAAVTSLNAQPGAVDGSIDLSWITPGDDVWANTLSTGSQFKIQHSSWDGNWDRDSVPALSTSGVPPYTQVFYNVTGLTGGDTYYFMIWYADELSNWSGDSNVSSSTAQTDSTPPSAVTDLSASIGFSEGQARLTWSIPGDDNLSGTLMSGSAFKIQRSTWWDGIEWSTGSVDTTVSVSTSGIDPSTQIYYTVTDLTGGLNYYFKIWHVDEAGNWSGLSNSATSLAQSDVEAPARVTEISGVTGVLEGEVILTWTVPGDDVWEKTLSVGSEYKILHSTKIDTWPRAMAQITVSTSGVAPHTEVSYVVTGLAGGETNYLMLWYKDESDNWSERSSTATVWAQVDVTKPGKVTNLTGLVSVLPREISLSWSVPGDDLYNNEITTGSILQIQYDTDSGVTWSSAAALVNISTQGVAVGTTVTYTITGLAGSTTYYAKIWYTDEIGNLSDASNLGEAKTLDDFTEPADVTDLVGTEGDEGEINLSWSIPGDDGWTVPLSVGSIYRIQYSTVGITWSTAAAQIEEATSGVEPNTILGHTITGLRLSATYYIKIWHADGAGNWSQGLSNTATIYAESYMAITTVSPDNGSNKGTVDVAINGEGFLSGSDVRLKKSTETIVATNINVVSANEITCRFDLTMQTTGYWDVEVTSGIYVLTKSSGFMVESIAVESITPNSGAFVEAIDVTIQGLGFETDNIVKLKKAGETDITGTNVVTLDSETITVSFDIVGKTSGNWDVEVSTQIGGNWYIGTLLGGFEITLYTYTDIVNISKDASGLAEILPETGKIEAEVESGTFAEDVVLTLSTDTVAGSNQASIRPTLIGISITNNKALQPEIGITITIRYRDADIAGL
ncbi:FG-GAP-like repeat-containing protein, partial [Elusimicrobiota bacterium]